MIDLNAKKVVTLGKNAYEIGKVPMRVFGLTQATLASAASELEVEKAVINTAYEFIPYYLVSAKVGKDKMEPPNVQPEWSGVLVRKADVQWISDNVPPEDAAELLMAGQDFNTLSVEEIKN